MIKKFRDYIKNGNVNSSELADINETQKELNDGLNDSIKNDDYDKFIYYINKGADINNVVDNISYINNISDYQTNPIILTIMYDRIKMLKKLIGLGADLINVSSDIDIYDYIMKVLEPKHRSDIISYILKKHPSFIDDVELRKNANKYNI